MSEICRKKFKACVHAKNALIESRSEIAEATFDKWWGTGFDMDQMLEYLPNFWPGQNLMGKILKSIKT